jgi:hypothetical protein
LGDIGFERIPQVRRRQTAVHANEQFARRGLIVGGEGADTDLVNVDFGHAKLDTGESSRLPASIAYDILISGRVILFCNWNF